MKKIIALAVFVLTFSMNTQAQKKQSREKGKDLTIEQKTTLAIKKMTLNLDLSEGQQNQIRPLISKKISDRSNMKESRERQDSSSNIDHFQIQNKRLDKMIAFKKEMKSILNTEQYERFEKSTKRKMHKKKKHQKGKSHTYNK